MGAAHSSPLSTQPPAGETQPHNAPSTGTLNFAKASTIPKPKAPVAPAAPVAPVTQGGGRRGKSRRNKNRKNKSNKNRKNKNRK
jgi:hypothetical protein